MHHRARHPARWVVEALRRALAVGVGGLRVLGATYCGDADLLLAMQSTRTRPLNRVAEPAAVAREMLEGIAEIEAFLAVQAARADPEDETWRPDRDDRLARPPTAREDS